MQQRIYDLQYFIMSIKYLFSGPLTKKFADLYLSMKTFSLAKQLCLNSSFIVEPLYSINIHIYTGN